MLNCDTGLVYLAGRSAEWLTGTALILLPFLIILLPYLSPGSGHIAQPIQSTESQELTDQGVQSVLESLGWPRHTHADPHVITPSAAIAWQCWTRLGPNMLDKAR